VRTILIADDDEDIRAYLEVTLELAGYQVLHARDGLEAIQRARTGHPDLIILDVMMPGLDGMETLERLRGSPRTSHLPVVMLSARAQREDAIAGLIAGADDYLTKPVETDELLARIFAAMRRADQQRSRNPLTGLPGNESILAELSERLAGFRPVALLYVDLDQFKPFNDHYGFLRGDEALNALGKLLLQLEDELGGPGTFVGHVGGDDFVVICAPSVAEDLARAICERFDALAPSFYDLPDRRAGSIEVPDRRGVPQRYELLSLSIGIATTENRAFAHQGEVVATATEMKRYAKSRNSIGSRYAIDRRQEPGEVGLDLEVELPT
jgi:diguanylate cyclase (GGDEF)-like protein